MLTEDQKHRSCVGESAHRDTQTSLVHLELKSLNPVDIEYPSMGTIPPIVSPLSFSGAGVSPPRLGSPAVPLSGALPVPHLGFSNVSSEVRQAGPPPKHNGL